MAGPWEKFQKKEGPWTKFARPSPAPIRASADPAGESWSPHDPVRNDNVQVQPTGEMSSYEPGMMEQAGNFLRDKGVPLRRVASDLQSLDDAMRGVANGATFGMADRFAGGMDALTGQAEGYDDRVAAQVALSDEARQRNPNLALAGEIAGGLMTASGLVKNGVTLAGRFGSGLLPRILSYGIEGAGYGGAHGAGNTHSDDWRDYLANAGEGASVGLLAGGLPVAGTVASGLYRGAKAALGPKVQDTSSRIVSALLRGGAQADEAGLRALPGMGDEAMLVDAGPSFLGLGQGVGSGVGPGRTQLVEALRARDAGTGPRLEKAMTETLGPAPIPSRVDAGIRANQKALSPAYEAAFGGAKAVDTDPIAGFLESAAVNKRGSAQTAAAELRKSLNITGTDQLDPNPRTLLSVRQDIDALLKTADDNSRPVLAEARRMVDAELTAKVPGIKDVDAQFAELARQRQALERGQTMFDTGREVVTRPAELADELASAGGPQGTMVGPSGVPLRMRQGARAELDRLVGTHVNDLTTLERTLATPQDWNFQKAGMLFGEGPRDKIAAELMRNRLFRDSYQKIAQNSQTAQRTGAAKLLDAPELPKDATVTGLGIRAVQKIAQMLVNSNRAGVRDEMGALLSRAGPEAQKIIQELLAGAANAGKGAAAIRGAVENPAYLGASGPVAGRR